jgi:DNA repair photolyase
MSDSSLFPILPPQVTGIARMAAEAEFADEGHLVEFRSLKVRSVLNKSVSKRRLWTAYSINPYRGCEFGCRYCYARYTHEFLAPKAGVDPKASGDWSGEKLQGDGDGAVGAVSSPKSPEQSGLAPGLANLRDPEAFERRIFIKQNAAWLVEQELKKIPLEEEIAIGTATDPYQPIERRAKVTQSILEVLARRAGRRIGIVTKSTLVTRDIDLLVEIARRNRLVLHITITTPDVELARKLEPRAPRPDLRFATVTRLRAAGLTAGILCSPLLPGITDTANALDQMARQAAAARASFFSAQPLFLKPCSRPTYLSFVREHFPALEADYAKRFGDRDFATPKYSRELARMVEAACRRYGLGRRSSDALLSRELPVASDTLPGLNSPPSRYDLLEREAGELRRPAGSVIVQLQQRLFA